MGKKVKRKKSIISEKLNLVNAIIFVLVLLIFSSFLFLLSDFIVNQKEEKTEEKEETKPVITENSLSLVMVGNCLIHGAIYDDAKNSDGTYDFRKMITHIKPIIESYDLAFYNQESTLGGTSLGLSSYPRFNSPQEVGDAFVEAGFNLVSLANNHTLDRGKSAIKSSLDYWKSKSGVMTSGSFISEEERITPNIMEKNGITYSLLAYTTTTNGLPIPKDEPYLVSVYNEETVKEDIERVRDKVDIVLVSMHWGEEYQITPNDNQRQIAEYLSSLGVDIIIGHHPHVVQAVDFIGNTMVVYSLGNFISSQYGVNKLTGLMVSITIKKVTTDDKSEITLENPTVELTYTSSKITSYRSQYVVYPYKMLNDDILKNYKNHYKTYMDIVTSLSDGIIPIGI